jgi:putative spermidine/putrescine transport system substrate-binding protein
MITRRKVVGTTLAAGAAFGLGLGRARAQEKALCYNCPSEWADWAGQLRKVKERIGIEVPIDNRNSGQALATLIAEKANPVADVAYFGGQFGIQAKKAGVITPYKAKNWDDVPADLKDPEGYWTALHTGALGFFVNTKAFGRAALPRSWADLLKPEYKGLVGYYDVPTSAGGYVMAVAVNLALGGNLDQFDPAIKWFTELQKNAPIIPKQTAYARVLSGEIPLLVDFDFNAYRAQYKDSAPAQFIIPAEGTVTFPYVMTLVKGGPNPELGKKIIDFTLSDEGQRHWSEAFMRPVRQSAFSPEAAKRFLPASEYARAKALDVEAVTARQEAVIKRYQNEVR